MTDDCSLSNLFPLFLFRSSALEGCLPYRSLCSHNGSTRAACSAQCFQRRSCHEAQCLIPLGRQALCLSPFPHLMPNLAPARCCFAHSHLRIQVDPACYLPLCLGLSHACLSISALRAKPRTAHYMRFHLCEDLYSIRTIPMENLLLIRATTRLYGRGRC